LRCGSAGGPEISVLGNRCRLGAGDPPKPTIRFISRAALCRCTNHSKMLGHMTSDPETWIYGNHSDPKRRDLIGLKASWIVRRLSVRRGLSVLDYGCGEGKHLHLIRQFAPDAALVGVDIRHLHRRPDFEFHKLKPREPLPFADMSFDVVISCDVLEHVDSIERSLDEICRVLRPRGAFIGFVPLEGGLKPHSFFRLINPDVYRDAKDHNRYFTNREMRGLLAARVRILRFEYSYHLLGGSMDAAFFASFKLPRVGNKIEQFWRGTDNASYQRSDDNSRSSLLGRLVEMGNTVAYYESTLLRNVSISACGLHFHVEKLDAGTFWT
jgi:SAM-dependent methyltransferase